MKSSRTARALTAGLSAAAIAAVPVAVGVATASSAEAASKVTFCFNWPSGNPYAHHKVWLVRKIDGTPKRLRSTTTDATGCGQFVGIRTDRTVWVRAAFVKETAHAKFWWAGSSPLKAEPGRGTVHLGTGKVRLIRGISAVGPIARR